MRRSYKEFSIKVVKWTLYVSIFYGLFVLLTKKSNESMKMDKVATDEDKVATDEDNVATDEPNALMDITSQPPKKEICPRISVPWYLSLEGTWQAIDEGENMFILSAYYSKERKSVFVIGVRPDPESEESVICQLWTGDAETGYELMEETEARQSENWEYRGYEYTSIVFECPVQPSEDEPAYVSMVTKSCASPINVLTIQSASNMVSYKRRLTVCLKPLVLNFDKTLQFSKWVEINKLLGVERFVVYNYSCGPNMNSLLEYYTKKEVVEVVQWAPPFVVNGLYPENRPVQLENYGEVAALNDCLFRSKRTSKFITNIDINEFIIPRDKDSTVVDMINEIGLDVDAYYISMAFIRKVAKANTFGEVKYKHSVHTGHMGARVSKPIIRTSQVDFTLMRKVPDVDSFIVQPHRSVLHLHPGIGQNQLLGTVIDDLLSPSFMEKVIKAIINIKKNLDDIDIK